MFPLTAATCTIGRAPGWGWTKTFPPAKNCWLISAPSSSTWHRRALPRGRSDAMWTISGYWAERSSATCTTTLLWESVPPNGFYAAWSMKTADRSFITVQKMSSVPSIQLAV